MTRTQMEYLKMFAAVDEAITECAPMWQPHAAISNYQGLLQQFISDIGKTDELKFSILPKAITGSASSMRKYLTDEAFVIKETLKFYYSTAAMDDEKVIFTYPVSRIILLRKNDFYMLLKDISERATALKTQLAPLGLSAQKINKFAADVNNFYTLITSREKQVTKRKNTTATVAQLVNNCRLMLRNDLDTVVNTLKQSQEEFWFLYNESRRLVRIGGRRNYYTVVISGKVSDAKTKKLLDNVTVTPETKGKPAITANKGKFSVKM